MPPLLDRRAFLTGVAGVGTLAAARPRPSRAAEAPAGAGPHLFLDDFLVAASEGLVRVVQRPRKVAEPVLTSTRFGVTQPYLTVVRDPGTGRVRLWYNRGPAVWMAESPDGLRFEEPRVAWAVRRGYGASLVDDGPGAPDAARRFKLANWQSDPAHDDTPRDNGGLFVGFSPDGLRWTPHPANPVLRTYPTGWPKFEKHGVGDTVDVFRDPVRGRYACAVKLFALPEDGYAPAPKAGAIYRRLVGMTTSADFVRWEQPWRIFVPDARDEGLLEFYGMGGMHARGPLLIGLVRVLRDDLPCDPGGPPDGIGYTTLAVSRDGVAWERFREPFLDRAPEPGWDHAMAWAGAVLPDGDDLLVYYGGYARGHKIEPTRERQIGVARLTRDRYAARRAGRTRGLLRTRPLLLPAGRVTVNAAVRGELRVRLLRADGAPVPGFDWAEVTPARGDGVALPVRWPRPLGARAEAVRLEFSLREADLYAFEVTP